MQPFNILMLYNVFLVVLTKEKMIKKNYYIWLPIGELVDVPCDPLLINTNQSSMKQVLVYAAAEWYDIGGFYLHSGFILPVKAFSERHFYGLICNVRSIKGEILLHIEHHVTVYYKPNILWTFKLTLNKSVLIENGYLKKAMELKFLKLSEKLNLLCVENDACYYQFTYFHKSTYQYYLLNNEGFSDNSVERNMEKLDGESIPLTFYFKVNFVHYSALLVDPFSNLYKDYITQKQKQFSIQLEENAIDLYISNSMFYGGKKLYEMNIELICPSGSEDVVGFITCQKCRAGYYAKPGSLCQPCEYGTFQNNPGSSDCNICPDLYTTLERASKVEEDCIFDGPLWTTIFVYISRKVWANVVTSYRTFSVKFLLASFIYFIVSVIIIGWLSYRIHLYRKIKKRRDVAFEQLLSIGTIGNINLDLDQADLY